MFFSAIFKLYTFIYIKIFFHNLIYIFYIKYIKNILLIKNNSIFNFFDDSPQNFPFFKSKFIRYSCFHKLRKKKFMKRRTFNNLILGATIMNLSNKETNAAATLNNFELHPSNARGGADHGWLN